MRFQIWELFRGGANHNLTVSDRPIQLSGIQAMKLSESPDYKAAVFASVNGQLDDAKQAFERLLDQAEANDDDVAISFLLQSLGNVEARLGNIELGHELHLRAVGQSRGVPLNLIVYAKGLVNYFDDSDSAEQKLKQAESLIASDKWNRRLDTNSPESYAIQIAEVRKAIADLR